MAVNSDAHDFENQLTLLYNLGAILSQICNKSILADLIHFGFISECFFLFPLTPDLVSFLVKLQYLLLSLTSYISKLRKN